MHDETKPEPLMTPQEVMAHYRISKPTVFNWVKRGCPVVRLPRNFRFRRHEVEAWLEAQSAQ